MLAPNTIGIEPVTELDVCIIETSRYLNSLRRTSPQEQAEQAALPQDSASAADRELMRKVVDDTQPPHLTDEEYAEAMQRLHETDR
jgi:hypothetical protein